MNYWSISRNFPRIFGALNELLEFLWNSFVLKMYFRKLKKENQSYLTGPSPKARPRFVPAQPSARAEPIWA
jgi:hypothetical protein